MASKFTNGSLGDFPQGKGPAPATPAFVFPKDPPELDEAQSGTLRMLCGGNSCDVHMDEETTRGDEKKLNYYPKCQGKDFILVTLCYPMGAAMSQSGGFATLQCQCLGTAVPHRRPKDCAMSCLPNPAPSSGAQRRQSPYIHLRDLCDVYRLGKQRAGNGWSERDIKHEKSIIPKRSKCDKSIIPKGLS
ncbi:hypothetical protein TURU_086877 [Turdus rufiventris]|nr:hypothetical protein TURU_086877 [Turdus rufiventris]